MAKQSKKPTKPAAQLPVFFCDAWAVTRLVPPSRLKSKHFPDGSLRLDAKPPHALLIEWTSPLRYLDDSLTVRAFPLLHNDALLPDGSVLRTNADERSLVTMSHATKLSVAKPSRDLGDLSLGPLRAATEPWQLEPAVSNDLGVAVQDGPCGIALGTIDPVQFSVTLHARLTLTHTRGAQHVALPGSTTHVVAVLDRATERVYLALVANDGTLTQRETPAVQLPVREGDSLVFLQDEGTVVRQTLTGEELERFELPEEHRGLGRVYAQENTVYFLPDHGLCILDLSNGKTLDRKSDAEQAPVRQHLTTALRRVNTAGRAANLQVFLPRVRVSSGSSKSFTPGYLSDGGDGGVLSAILLGAVTASRFWLGMIEGWDRHGWGHSSIFPPRARTSDTDELCAAFAILDEHHLHALHGWSHLRGLQQNALERFFPNVPPLLTPEAAELLLYVLLHSLSNPPPKQVPLMERWRTQRLTPETTLPLLVSLQHIGSMGSFDGFIYGIDTLVCLLADLAWGSSGSPVLEHLTNTNPTPYGNANRSHLQQILTATQQRR